MSDLTRLRDYVFKNQGDMSPEAFALKQLTALKGLIGKPATDEALSKAEDEIKVVKAKVEEAVDTYLKDKLDAGVAEIAEAISDGALNALQAALLGVISKAKGNGQ